MVDMKFKLVGLTSVLILALSGCATSHKKVEGAAAAEQSAGGEASAPAAAAQPNAAAGDTGKAADKTATAAPAAAAPEKPSISGSDVNAIEQKMAHYPRILWHSRDNTYRFYVGTVVFAEYNPFKNTFMIMTDNADRKNLVCKYDSDSGWKVEGSSQGASCKGLLNEMDEYLSRSS